MGIRDKKTVPTLAEFIEKRFAPWAQSATCPKTWLDYYRPGLRVIGKYKPLVSLRLNEITSERASDFAAWRPAKGLQASSVNSSLQVLRRMLHIAVEWGAIEKAPRIELLSGERRREHVVGEDECSLGTLGLDRHSLGRHRDATGRVLLSPMGDSHVD